MALTVLHARETFRQFLSDVRHGLEASPRYLPSRWLYDDEGSRLFEQIMALPEYYPYRCEKEIFQRHKGDVLNELEGLPFALVDLGAGDGDKTNIFLEYFIEKGAPFTYVPIDISKEVLEESEARLAKRYPQLKVEAVVAEYFDALDWLRRQADIRKLVLFMGGNIGNFEKQEALKFLRRMHNVLEPQDMLLTGFDLKKAPQKILLAYDDPSGVTAKFNLNLLTRMNRELGANFQVEQWAHYPTYHPHTGAAESFLVSLIEQEVYFSSFNKKYRFDASECIHTEFSMKYTREEVSALAKTAGFQEVDTYTSTDSPFTDVLWKREA